MKKLIWILLICFAAILPISPAQVLAAENSWSRSTLEKVPTGPVIVDPARSDNLYASTALGVQKSSDGGKTWTIISRGLPDEQAVALVINPLNSQMLYIGYDGQGIYKSTDGGITWTPKNDGLPSRNVRTITFHPKDPNILYAGIKGGVCITNNAGERWSPTSGFNPFSNVNTIIISPQDPTVLYAGTGSEGVYKSTNGGVSWKDINTGLDVLSVLTLSLDPSNPEHLVAGTYNAVSPTDLYVGGVYGGIFYSLDGGNSWKAAKSLSSLTVFQLARLPQNPAVIYASTLGGAYRSIDGGITWVDINSGLSNEFLHYLTVMRQGDQAVLLTSTPNGIFTYTDSEWNTIKAHLRTVPKWVWYSSSGAVLLVLITLIVWFRLRSRKVQKKKYAW